MCARLLRSSLGRVLVFVAVLPCVHLPAVDLVALDLILRERVRCVAVDTGAAIAPPHARSALLEAAVFPDAAGVVVAAGKAQHAEHRGKRSLSCLTGLEPLAHPSELLVGGGSLIRAEGCDTSWLSALTGAP